QTPSSSLFSSSRRPAPHHISTLSLPTLFRSEQQYALTAGDCAFVVLESIEHDNLVDIFQRVFRKAAEFGQLASQGCEFCRFPKRSEEHTSELQSHLNLVCRLLLDNKKSHIHY